MQKIVGGVVTIGGLIALIYTLINYINNTASFSFLGSSGKRRQYCPCYCFSGDYDFRACYLVNR